MAQTLLQLLLTILMYSIAGAVVGIGVELSRKFPKIGEFMKQRPVLGWTLAFTLAAAATTVLITVVEGAALVVLSFLLR